MSADQAVASRVMEMSFPGGAVVEAVYRGHTICTDQPEKAGGTGTAPPPFDLFLASIGTCAGYYVLRFCQERRIPTSGLRVTLEPVRSPDGKRFSELRIDVTLPAGFPEKYHRAVLRAVNQCAVKRHIVEPPEFTVRIKEGV